MCALAALVSGVIVHRSIFADFFTFRPRKGQRSWLDAHNASAVFTLPFCLMIVHMGRVYFYSSYMPWPLQTAYGADEPYARYLQELAHDAKAPVVPNRSGTPAQLLLGKPATLLHALVRPPGRAWVEQFAVAAALCLALPLLNQASTGQ